MRKFLSLKICSALCSSFSSISLKGNYDIDASSLTKSLSLMSIGEYNDRFKLTENDTKLNYKTRKCDSLCHIPIDTISKMLSHDI